MVINIHFKILIFKKQINLDITRTILGTGLQTRENNCDLPINIRKEVKWKFEWKKKHYMI